MKNKIKMSQKPRFLPPQNMFLFDYFKIYIFYFQTTLMPLTLLLMADFSNFLKKSAGVVSKLFIEAWTLTPELPLPGVNCRYGIIQKKCQIVASIKCKLQFDEFLYKQLRAVCCCCLVWIAGVALFFFVKS